MAAAQRLTDAVAHVPRGEHSGPAGLQRQRLPRQWPAAAGALAASPPVTRYPAVLVTSPLPAAPSVRGVPPMQMNKASTGNRTGSVASPSAG